MTTVNIHEAKTHLSQLLQDVSRGEQVIIARAGKPVARLVPIEEAGTPSRLGFLEGSAQIPSDFNELGAEQITAMFGGE